MFRQIMVPLDGSELAEWAIPIAEQLAVLTGGLAALSQCTVHLVRVIDLTGSATWAPSFGMLPEGWVRTEEAEARAYLEDMRSRLQADGVQVRAEEVAGDTVGTLLRYEAEAGIELVVMCSHLRSGVSRLALGSVAEQLLRQGSAPILLVHAGIPTVDLRHAIVPLDGSPFAEQALEVVRGLAQYVVRRVSLVHVLAEHEEARLSERYLAFRAQDLQHQHLQCEYQVLRGVPAQEIVRLANEGKLLVMTTHCRNVLSRVARGSVTDQVLHRGTTPVLLIRRWPCD